MDEQEQPAVRTVTLLESDLPKLVFAFPLSKHTTCTMRVDGPFGEREANNLRRLLELHVEMLNESEPTPPRQGAEPDGQDLNPDLSASASPATKEQQ